MSLPLRLTAVSACLLAGILRLRAGSPWGWVLLAVAVLLTVNLFLYGSIYTAFHRFKRGNFAGAERAIRQTPFPRLLTPRSRAYRHWILGALAASKEDWNRAAERYHRALEGRLRTPNDRAAAYLGLAQAVLERGDVAAARDFLDQATTTPHRDELDPMLARFEAVLSAAEAGAGGERRSPS